MIIPQKFENLHDSLLVIWAKILKDIQKEEVWNIYTFYDDFSKKYALSFDTYSDILLFFWLTELIQIKGKHFYYKKIKCI